MTSTENGGKPMPDNMTPDQLTEAPRPSLTARFEGCGHDTVIADLTGELDRVTEERDGLLLERDRWATPPAIPEFGR